MKPAVKYIYDVNPIFVHWKKHFCPKCGKRMSIRFHSKTVNSASFEARKYDFSLGDTFLVGNVEFRTPFFYCNECHCEVTAPQMKEIERRKH